MERIITIILPIFGVALLGFLSGRLGVLGKQAATGLNEFVFKLALPVMLFHMLGTLELPELQWRGMGAYYLSAVIMLLTTAFLSRRLLKQNVAEAAALGMGTAFSNTVLLGFPIVSRIYGEEGLLVLLVVISCHMTVLFGVGTIYVEAGRAGRKSPLAFLRDIFKGLLTNPIIIGLACGALFNVSGANMPGPLDEMCGMFREAAVPCALFTMGLSLCDFRLRGNLVHTSMVVGMKLVVHPLIMWLLATQVFGLSKLWTGVTVAAASMPCGVNAYIFAQGYKAREMTVAAAVLISTPLSILTISLVLLNL